MVEGVCRSTEPGSEIHESAMLVPVRQRGYILELFVPVVEGFASAWSSLVKRGIGGSCPNPELGRGSVVGQTAVTVDEFGPVNSGSRMIGGPGPGIVDVRVGVEKVEGSGILSPCPPPAVPRPPPSSPPKGSLILGRLGSSK